MNRKYLYLLIPVLAFDVIAFAIPMIEFLRDSLHPFTGQAEVGTSWTLANYGKVFSDPTVRTMILNSVRLILIITAACFVIGFPVSYVIARSQRWGMVAFMVIIGSSFVSAVVQTLGWLMALSGSGPVIRALSAIGLADSGTRILQTPTAVVLGMAQAEVHYMILVCVPIILAIPRETEEAAAGLGASWARMFTSVVMRQSLPGILAGCLLVMATSAGSFTTPAILGGGLVPWLPVYVSSETQTALNYPMAATASVVLVAIVVLLSLIAGLLSRQVSRVRVLL